jgi:excisionase family DNA binding protein
MGFEQDRLYSTQEVADITGIPRVSLAMYARQGRIKAVKVGKNWRMKGSEVTAFLEKGTMQKTGEEYSGKGQGA